MSRLEKTIDELATARIDLSDSQDAGKLLEELKLIKQTKSLIKIERKRLRIMFDNAENREKEIIAALPTSLRPRPGRPRKEVAK